MSIRTINASVPPEDRKPPRKRAALPEARAAVRAGGVLPVAAILAAVILWGTSFSAMKTVVGTMGPWAVMWVRMALGAIMLLPVASRLVPRRVPRRDWLLLTPMAAFMPCLYFWLESTALTLTTSAQAGVVSASVPLLVAAGASVFLRERVGRGVLAGLVLAVFGVAWLTLAGQPVDNAPNPALGNILEFLAMCCAAGNMIIVKRLSARYNPWTLTGIQTVVGAVFFLPGAADLFSGRSLPQGPGQVAILVYLGCVVTLGAFGLYNWGMSRIPASRASAFINMVPVVAVIMGWAVLGEALNSCQMAASACVFAGVWLSQRCSRTRASRKVRPEAKAEG